MEDAFKTREQALENSFFRAVDAALIQRLRDEMANQECHDKLIQETGITDERLLSELMAAGVRPATLIAFLLLPLARVAWADGKVAAQERHIVLDTAVALGCVADGAGMKLLAHWLDEPPEDHLFDIWRSHAEQITEHLSHFAQRGLARTVVRRSLAVAKATGGLLGVRRVCPAERKVIEQIQAAFLSRTQEAT